MTIYRFQVVPTQRTQTGTCPVCGKRVVRKKRFEHTVNPFNKNSDGTVRTFDEVRAAVNAEADAWVPDFTHARCAAVSE